MEETYGTPTRDGYPRKLGEDGNTIPELRELRQEIRRIYGFQETQLRNGGAHHLGPNWWPKGTGKADRTAIHAPGNRSLKNLDKRRSHRQDRERGENAKSAIHITSVHPVCFTDCEGRRFNPHRGRLRK